MSDEKLANLEKQVLELKAETRALRITIFFAIILGNIDKNKLAGSLNAVNDMLLKGLSVETGELDRVKNHINDIHTQILDN